MIDWSTAPPWARFKATDSDGTEWWYENEPMVADGGIWDIPDGKCAYVHTPCKDWEESLEKRPTEKE